MTTGLREGIALRWWELLAVELVLEEVAGEFDGEAPTQPWEREALDDAKKRLEELHRAAQTYVGPFKLPAPDEEEMEQVRGGHGGARSFPDTSPARRSRSADRWHVRQRPAGSAAHS